LPHIHLPSIRCVKSYSRKSRRVASALLYCFRRMVYLLLRLPISLKPKYASRLLVPGLLLVLRYVFLGKYGRLHEPNASNASHHSSVLERHNTEMVLQRQAHQDPLMYGHFKPLKGQAVCTQRATVTASIRSTSNVDAL
jgi:hypothetical protein